MSVSYNNQISLVPIIEPNIFNVQLKIESKTRFIGKIDFSEDGTFTTQRTQNHLFRKLNALGINHELLTNDSIRFKWIVINYEGKSLVTTRNYFLQNGKTFQFGNKGFELQVFLPLSEFGINKARLFEAKRIIQTDLFGEVI